MDLRVLLLSADGGEPAFEAWEAALDREGVPYDAIVARAGHPPIDAATLMAGPAHARYQAVIVAAGGLPSFDGARYVSVLSAAEWAALAAFERAFGIRRITGFAYPSALYGLGPAASSGLTAGIEGHLTTAGGIVFDDLCGPVPLDPRAYAHLARPADPRFTTLVEGPGGSALVGVYVHPDGREELVCTVDGNAAMIHSQLLRHGMLRWVTRGVYLGRQRHHLALHVDDVFISDDRWDPASASTVPGRIRMTRDDVEAAVAWSRRRRVRLDLTFNGHGAGGSDDLTTALLEHARDFGWINHTFSHRDFDAIDARTMRNEIRRNVAFAAAAGLRIDRRALVTGAHAGLAAPQLAGVLKQTGVRWIAADNSRDPAQRAVGGARTVPRHPTNMYFNVSTRAAQLDEYDHLRSERERPGPGTATQAVRAATSWRTFCEREAATILGHVLANDPRPHYVHQSNIAGDRMLYDLVDAVLWRHRELFCIDMEQPTLAQSGRELARRRAWQDACAEHRVTAYVAGGRLHLSSTAPVEVPLTGIAGLPGAEESCWSPAIGPEDGHVVLALA